MTPSRAGRITPEDVEALALNVLGRNGVRRPPVDVDAIALDEGLEFTLIRTQGRGSGAYYRDAGGRGRAFIQANEGRTRQRFTKAHELAHHVMDPPVLEASPILPSGYRGRDRHWAHEKFAAYLLMPRSWIGDLVRQGGWQMDREALLHRVARQFDVSRAAAEVRLRELGHIE